MAVKQNVLRGMSSGKLRRTHAGSNVLNLSLSHRCRRIEDGTLVAIKKIAKVPEDDQGLEEFSCLSLANQQGVPNIVQLIELLEGDQTHSYLVLE